MATKEATKERTGSKLMEPKIYQVIMLNDDFTSMEFVVAILIDIFHKSPVDAEALMLHVHRNGRAVVGKYPYDIAVTKVKMSVSRAREQGFPFRMTVEEE